MKTIRIKNLRSILDTSDIEVKPITILVGKNNSGKSSFLRLFSLLRQSVESRTRSPLLWYGQYVDYGSFKDALRKESDNGKITLAFSFEISQTDIESIIPRRYFRQRLDSIANKTLMVEMELALGDKERTYVSHVKLGIDDSEIMIDIDRSNKVIRFIIGSPVNRSVNRHQAANLSIPLFFCFI
ncbi:MAG: AAA family ATPase, partial [Smithella sp.]